MNAHQRRKRKRHSTRKERKATFLRLTENLRAPGSSMPTDLVARHRNALMSNGDLYQQQIVCAECGCNSWFKRGDAWTCWNCDD